MITLLEAINERHSIRRYLGRPIAPASLEVLKEAIYRCNREGNLHIQLVVNEPKCFSGLLSYGTFVGVEHYLVMAGVPAHDLDERVGYYGEQLVLLAQQLNLGTCWAGLTYRKVKNTYKLNDGEKVVCMIAIGCPDEDGHKHKRKKMELVSNADATSPAWFVNGVKAALRGPSAINQQKYYFEYLGQQDGRNKVRAKTLFSLVGYTRIDLGIAKLHFEIAAGKENFDWVD